MTTTNDSAIRKIIALRDRALHASTPAPEADTAMTMARKLCTKYGIDVAILDRKPETAGPTRTTHNGQAQPMRKHACRFGCGTYVMHTAEEMSACADRARARSATGSAYDAPGAYNPGYQQRTSSSGWFDDFMRDYARQSQSHANASSGSTSGRANAGHARPSGSHAYCTHEATKSARAKCRRERGY